MKLILNQLKKIDMMKKFKEFFLNEPMNTIGDIVGQENLPWVLLLIILLVLWFLISNIKTVIVIVIGAIIIKWCLKHLSKLNKKKYENRRNNDFSTTS